NDSQQWIERQAKQGDIRLEKQQHAECCRDTFSTIESQERAPAVSHYCSDTDPPKRDCRRLAPSQQRQCEISFSEIADQANCGSPPARNTADVAETGILRPDFGNVDPGAQHRNFREWNGANEERREEFQDENHFTL